MIGYHKRDSETFPVHTPKRVDRPTTLILDDKVQRVDERESGFNKASDGIIGNIFRKKEDGSFLNIQPLVLSPG